MALGMSTALCTTLSGLIGSVLTKIQMVILENNSNYRDPIDIDHHLVLLIYYSICLLDLFSYLCLHFY